jgi:hypothetical protein
MTRIFRGLGILVGSILLVSCSGIPAHRAAQCRDAFDFWDEPTRTRLLDARAQVGDTRTMVYIAFGTPLKAPTLTDDTPPLEHWEYLTYETVPAFPAGADTPLSSSPSQPSLRADTVANVVFPNLFTAPPLRLLVVEFGPDDRLVSWKLYPDAQGRAIGSDFKAIELPQSPRPKP